MKKTLLFLSMAICAVLLTVSCNQPAEEKAESTDETATEVQAETTVDPELGKNLVNQLWEAILAEDTTSLDAFMAEDFQSVHEDGAIGKAAELALISGLSIDTYTISELKVSQDENVIIATYMVSVEETIEGERLSKDPAARMSVFVKEEGEWKFMAHANLKPLKDHQ